MLKMQTWNPCPFPHTGPIPLRYSLSCTTPEVFSQNQDSSCSGREAAAQNQLWERPPEPGSRGAPSARGDSAPGIHEHRPRELGHSEGPGAPGSQVKCGPARFCKPGVRALHRATPSEAGSTISLFSTGKGLFKAALSPAFYCSFLYL